MKIFAEGALSCALGLNLVDKIVLVSLELWSASDSGKQNFRAGDELLKHLNTLLRIFTWKLSNSFRA